MRALPCRTIFSWVKRYVSLKVEALEVFAKLPSPCLFDRLANDKLTLNGESFGFYKIRFMASLQHSDSLRRFQSVKNLRVCQDSLRICDICHLEDTSSEFRLIYVTVNVLVKRYSDLDLLNRSLRFQVLLDGNRIIFPSFWYLRVISQNNFLYILVNSDFALIR
jgi:hypothetical protein